MVEVEGQLGCSDHKGISFQVDWEVPRTSYTVMVPDFRKANYEALRRNLEEINWRSLGMDDGQDLDQKTVTHFDHVDTTYNNLVKAIVKGQKQHIPYRTIRSNLDPKWMTRRLKHEIGLKRGIYKRIKNSETYFRNSYAELLRSVKRNSRSAKRKYEIRGAREAKKDPKGFFQMYRTKAREK